MGQAHTAKARSQARHALTSFESGPARLELAEFGHAISVCSKQAQAEFEVAQALGALTEAEFEKRMSATSRPSRRSVTTATASTRCSRKTVTRARALELDQEATRALSGPRRRSRRMSRPSKALVDQASATRPMRPRSEAEENKVEDKKTPAPP